MSNKLIDIVDITKSFDDTVVLDKLNLYIRENEFLTLLGPSGCGKTTLLRILGGFETPDSGDIIFDGKNINKLPPNRRQLNTVFQKYALFSHMINRREYCFRPENHAVNPRHISGDKIQLCAEAGQSGGLREPYPGFFKRRSAAAYRHCTGDCQ